MAEESIKEKLAKLLFSNEVEVEFSEMKTADGIILNVSALEKDGIVKIVSEDGKELAPEGDYILEDGSTIVVGAEGVIVEIKPAEEVKEEMSENGLEAFEERIASIESLLESKFNEAVTSISSIIEEKDLEIKDLKEKFEAFSKLDSLFLNKSKKKTLFVFNFTLLVFTSIALKTPSLV